MPSIIQHTATIVNVTEGFVMLSMDKKPACSGCAMNKMCGVSDCSKDTIKVPVKNSNSYFVGEEVLLTSTTQKGYLALFFGYILPFIFVVLTLALLSMFNYTDLIIGIGALLSLLIYYTLLWIFRQYIAKKFTVQIQKKI